MNLGFKMSDFKITVKYYVKIGDSKNYTGASECDLKKNGETLLTFVNDIEAHLRGLMAVDYNNIISIEIKRKKGA